jgi:nicotinate-nucleotide--dimethylbenzimidazole phosphoribosyltransferase
MKKAKNRQDMLTKPEGSLGRLEELSVRIAGITGKERPVLEKKAVLVFAGDHGVVSEGVSAYPREVTAQMVNNFLSGGAAINVLARQQGARVVVVDAGVAANLPPQPDLRIRKIDYGTGNIMREQAMTEEQAVESICLGISLIDEEIKGGLDIAAVGDMGIGNTTPAAAIAAVITGLPVKDIAGKGTGINDYQIQHKIAVIEKALRLHRPSNDNGLEILRTLGGFEIGGIAGAVLGAAAHRIPVIIDGFISTSGALIAYTLCTAAADYCIAGHLSVETGHGAMLYHLGLIPCLDLGMRLGEGTGAVLAMGIVEAACRILDEMATSSEAGVTGRE